MEQKVKIYTGHWKNTSALQKAKEDSEKLLKKGWYILQTESGVVLDIDNSDRETLQVMVVYRRKA